MIPDTYTRNMCVCETLQSEIVMDTNTQLLHSINAKLDNLDTRLCAIEAQGERHSFVQPKAKAKAVKAVKVAKATKRIDIEGHPTRATWTDQMKEASTEAYKASKGDYQARNRVGILAAQAVA